jgi:hypothetical protein
LRSCRNIDADLEPAVSDKCGGILMNSLVTAAARALVADVHPRTAGKTGLFAILIESRSSVPQDGLRDCFGPCSTDFAVFEHARQG